MNRAIRNFRQKLKSKTLLKVLDNIVRSGRTKDVE